MKRMKSIWMTIIIMILSVAMVIGSVSVIAFAAPGDYTNGAQVFANSSAAISEKVDFNDEVTLPEAATGVTREVYAPNGSKVTVTDNKFKADQVGTYEVKYIGGGNKAPTYTFNIYCEMETEYFIRIDKNGASIPTYIQKGSDFTLPSATLAYYDEDGKLVTMDEPKVEIKVKGETKTAGETYTADAVGNLYIQYYAKLGSGKFYTKDFTVKVQETFNDNAAPKLNVVNVPTDANVNKKVTLPVATATDDFDENIEIRITVTRNGQPVVETELDDNGFAIKPGEDAKAIEFDNDKIMSFYPTEYGSNVTYEVTYFAIDDAGKESYHHGFTISCADKAAPEFKEIADYDIPTAWGLNVNGYTDKAINFPQPTVVDNSGEVASVSFKVTDSNNKKTVIEFSNIKGAAGADGTKFTGSTSTYGDNDEVIEFNKDMESFPFYFNKYHGATAGDYTVEYKAKDAKGNTSTKTYKISLSSSFDYMTGDEVTVPTTVDLETPVYIALGKDEELTIPSPEVADEKDSNLKVVYEIRRNDYNADQADTFITVKGGEKAEIIVKENGDRYLSIVDEEKELKLSGATSLAFYVTATNDVGGVRANTSDGKVKSDSNDYSNVVNVLDAVASATFDTPDVSGITTQNGGINFKAQEEANLGGFEIPVKDLKYRFYTGFEVAVLNSNGNSLSGVSMRTYSIPDNANDKATIYVQGIQFTPASEDDYTLAIRIFDVSGNSDVRMFNFHVDKDDNNGGTASAASMPSTGDVNVSYNMRHMPNEIRTPDASKTYYGVYQITGNRFSIMGGEFTAKAQGTYTFQEGYYEKDQYNDFIKTADNYAIAVTDQNKPSVEAQGLMPVYQPKDAYVLLPNVVGVSKSGNASVKLAIKDKNGPVIPTEVTDETYRNDTTGEIKQLKAGDNKDGYTRVSRDEYQYWFKATTDGKYTFTYTATINGSTSDSIFNMDCGDVVAPSFTVTEPSAKVKLNSEFVFSAIEVTSTPDKDNASKLHYRKRLLDPSGEVVENATIDGQGTTYRDKLTNLSDDAKYKLTKSGDYTVEYTVKDEVGNETKLQYKITVTADSKGPSKSLAALSTVLIIVGVLLLGGLIVYFVRFRKVKK